jgi:hypothetical protein
MMVWLITKSPIQRMGLFANLATCELDVVDDVREDVADGRTKQGQNDNHYDGNQNKNQSVLNQTLTFLTWQKQHCDSPPFLSKVFENLTVF